MQKTIITLFAILVSACSMTAHAQFTDNFSDGDFTGNPAWSGNVDEWKIDSVNQLQSNDTVPNGIFYLSTANSLATQAQWDLFVQLSFNTSSQNYVDVYLTASDSNINATTVSGYFVRFGGISDDISLYRKDANGTSTILVDGVNGILNSSTNKINLRVTRNAANQWNVLRDISGTGSNYFLEGVATDAIYTTSAYFGILVKQSTGSFFKKHFFDDIIIQPLIPDTTPPTLQSVSIVSATALDVLFNEAVDATTAQTVTNYFVNNSIGNPATATIDAVNHALVHLTFATPFPNNIVNTITVSNVGDASGNIIVPATTTFTYVVDVTPPAIVSVTATSINAADVLFSEPVDAATGETTTNYVVNNGIGIPISALRDAANTALVHLSFGVNFNGLTNTLTANNVKDIVGNPILNGMATFTYFIPRRFDVVIDEIMSDPNPIANTSDPLPDAEYVEIKNTSGSPINLGGWRLTSSSSSSGSFSPYTLPADSFLILTSTSNALSFSRFGRVIGIPSFPSLSNSGSTLSLVSKEGLTIHTVSYDPTWFQNAVKSNGGWSLEMIDPKNPCTGGDNWRASTDARGGSPGIKNSIEALNPDQVPPILVRTAAIDSVTVLLTFSEAIDSTKGATTVSYSINNGIGTPIAAVSLQPDFTKVQLSLSSPLVRNTIYTITANNISDCSGNVITANTAKFGLPSATDSLDVVVNEILFNPKPNSVDYVEIYNRSQKILDLKNLYIANRSSSTNALGSITQVSTENILLFPGDYYVISENAASVKQNYIAQKPDNFADITMPSYPDDKGAVVLLNAVGSIVDEVDYDAKWHFALLANVEGIALERVDYNKPSQDAENWHSAATTVGYGTPTYQNSQYRIGISVPGEVTITPKVFSPDNDGFNDYTTINYQIEETGYTGKLTIFDAAGRPVTMTQNITLAQKGSIRWDGLDSKNQKVPVGSYVVFMEIFNLGGKRKSFKNVVVVAAKF